MPLEEYELRQLVWGWPDVSEPMEIVETIKGKEERRQRQMRTILDVDGHLYELDWIEGTPFGGQDIFENQPYRVKKRIKLVRVNDYVRV